MSTRTVLTHAWGAAALLALTLTSPAHAAEPMPGTLYHHTGQLGSTVALSDSTGKIVAEFDYTPNGTPRITSQGADVLSGVRFTGKAWESHTRLYDFGARYYDPALGRFLSADAARQTSSPYSYVGAAPLERVDPDGNVYFPNVSSRYTTLFKLMRETEKRLRMNHPAAFAGRATPSTQLAVARFARLTLLEFARLYEKDVKAFHAPVPDIEKKLKKIYRKQKKRLGARNQPQPQPEPELTVRINEQRQFSLYDQDLVVRANPLVEKLDVFRSARNHSKYMAEKLRTIELQTLDDYIERRISQGAKEWSPIEGFYRSVPSRVAGEGASVAQ